MKRWWIPALVVVLAVGGWWFLGSSREQSTAAAQELTTAKVVQSDIDAVVSATGVLMPERSQSLAFDTAGRVTEVLASEGDRVQAGQVLARLDATDLELSLQQAQAALAVSEANLARVSLPATEAQLASARAAVAAAEAALARLQQGPTDIDVQLAELNIAQAKNSLYGAQGNRDAIAGNPAAGGGSLATAEAQVLNAEVAVTIAELNRDKLLQPADASSLRNAEAQVAQARASLAQLQSLPTPEDVSAAEAQVAQARVSVALAQNRLADADLKAPHDGRLAALTVHVNDAVSPGLSVGSVIDDSRFHVDVAIDETDIAQIAVGQPARITLDAFPDAVVTGTVSAVNLVGSSSAGVVKYTVTIAIEPPALELRPQMTAAIDVLVETHQDALVVPNRALRRDTDGKYVEVVRAGVVERAPVQTGISNDEYTEILTGVSLGDEVVVARPRQSLITTMPFGMQP